MKKIVTLKELQLISEEKKASSKVVGLCHGVFDLLHLGHIYYLEEAKSMCDFLIVTLTDDQFVNKGPGRPHFNAMERAKALSSLEHVDYIAVNQWKTALNTLKFIKPSLYIKGPDYRDSSSDPTENLKKEIDAIQSAGGQFVTTSGKQYSSSRILNSHFESDENIKQFRDSIKLNFSAEDAMKSLNSFSDLKVLIVGEAMLDTYVFCETVGKAGKDPFLVSKKSHSETYLGGSLAGANNISDFVKKVKVLTYLGDRDTNLETIKEKLNKNVSIDFIKKNKSPTINKTRYIDMHTNTKINGVYDLDNEELSSKAEAQFLLKLNKIIDNYDMVIAMDFGHGLFTKKIIREISKKSKFLAVNVQQNSFNSGFYDISKFLTADLFTLHEGEMRQHFRDRYSPIDKLLLKLYKNSSFKNIIVTRGKNGSLLKSIKNRNPISCPGLAKSIVDRVGSGDALLVTSALSIAKGLSSEFSLLFGSISASEIIKSYANADSLKKADIANALSTFLK
jgi:rfaE bifunctional protein kinase chain/domain/rfaE bifunctional protein nucleotidyltransferase chain/domain